MIPDRSPHDVPLNHRAEMTLGWLVDAFAQLPLLRASQL